jgi:hypothetical protein
MFDMNTPNVTFFLVDDHSTLVNYSVFVDDQFTGIQGYTGNNSLTTITLPTLSEGMHSYVVQATDNVGNSANSTVRRLSVDTRVPSSSIISPRDGEETLTSVDITFFLNDAQSSALSYEIFVDGQSTGIIGGAIENDVVTETVQFSPGSHSFVVQATDLVGHSANSTVRTITVRSKVIETENVTIAAAVEEQKPLRRRYGGGGGVFEQAAQPTSVPMEEAVVTDEEPAPTQEVVVNLQGPQFTKSMQVHWYDIMFVMMMVALAAWIVIYQVRRHSFAA